MRKDALRVALLFGWLGLSGLGWRNEAAAAGEVTVTGLRCEHGVEPVGLGEARPCFEWRLQSARRGLSQSAYQIRVASRAGLLTGGAADLWDTGRVRSEQAHAIAYGGHPLQSSRRYYWTVRVWDEAEFATGDSAAILSLKGSSP